MELNKMVSLTDLTSARNKTQRQDRVLTLGLWCPSAQEPEHPEDSWHSLTWLAGSGCDPQGSSSAASYSSSQFQLRNKSKAEFPGFFSDVLAFPSSAGTGSGFPPECSLPHLHSPSSALSEFLYNFDNLTYFPSQNLGNCSLNSRTTCLLLIEINWDETAWMIAGKTLLLVKVA